MLSLYIIDGNDDSERGAPELATAVASCSGKFVVHWEKAWPKPADFYNIILFVGHCTWYKKNHKTGGVKPVVGQTGSLEMRRGSRFLQMARDGDAAKLRCDLLVLAACNTAQPVFREKHQFQAKHIVGFVGEPYQGDLQVFVAQFLTTLVKTTRRDRLTGVEDAMDEVTDPKVTLWRGGKL